jgi:hypothetical protein
MHFYNKKNANKKLTKNEKKTLHFLTLLIIF